MINATYSKVRRNLLWITSQKTLYSIFLISWRLHNGVPSGITSLNPFYTAAQKHTHTNEFSIELW